MLQLGHVGFTKWLWEFLAVAETDDINFVQTIILFVSKFKLPPKLFVNNVQCSALHAFVTVDVAVSTKFKWFSV